MGTRTIQNVYPVYRRFPCEATKISSRRVQFKRFSVWYSRPCSVNYFRISGESVSCDHHLGLHVLTRVVRQHRPQHLIVCLRGNDLDVADWDRSADCVLAKLVTFLTQLRNIFLLKTVTILSYIPRQRTRSISPDLYKLRVIEANCLLQDFCKHHQLSFWKLRGFFDSKQQILCDGVHLNHYGYHNSSDNSEEFSFHIIGQTSVNSCYFRLEVKGLLQKN